MTVADRGQRLHAEEKAIEEPFLSRGARDAVGVETVKGREEKIERDIDACNEACELRPAQTEQPAIDIAQLSFVSVDFDELDRAGAD